MASGPRLIEAAGGVLWRPALGGPGVEVALVHRPKYDDWSLPKGKLTSGEHPLLGGLREVWEETGYGAVPGRPLGEIRYLKDGDPKRVRYWAMQADGGRFEPNEEVDQLMWLPPREGQRHLLPFRDQRILAEFARDAEPTWPCLLVRHGSAGERSAWPGDDRERPLDDVGHEQAIALADVLSVFRIARVFSADVLRCLETVGPYAAAHELTVESEPLVSESGVAAAPDAAVERFVTIVSAGEPVAVCSQGKAMPELIAGLCRVLGYLAPPDPSTRKGGVWALHVAANGKPRLAGLERFDPPA
ncbi:MAG: 8-oxo-(d)GTP phosphatase [Frankiaceae bacterium]|jgi:8-oxo-dGTP diphosphatase|nr:8-oxo-(d)GTP phosphatase [Frankiaceae bacterium]